MTMTIRLNRSAALVLLALVGCALVVSACAGSVSSSATGSVPTVLRAYHPPANGCGSYSAAMPKDPDGLIASLDAEHRAAYPGYSAYDPSGLSVIKSAWADWKPSHPAPYRIAISWSALVSDFQVQMVRLLQKQLTQAGFQVTLRTTAQLDVGQQLSQFHSLVLGKPDLIILETPSPDAFIGPVDSAARQGIPTISFDGYVASPNAVDLDINFYLAHAEMTSAVARVLNGKGNVIYLHSISGVTIDSDAKAAWDAILARCPGMHKVGEVYGGFSDSLAKSELLRFLATHPQPVRAVLPTAAMSVGALKAFIQTGRGVPVVTDVGPTDAHVAYVNEQKNVPYIGVAFTPVANAAGIVDVARRMLDGQGVRMNVLLDRAPLVTNFNVERWTLSGWTLNSTGVAPGLRSDFFTDHYLAGFFAHPRPLE
jgi:ABC-type sugar transport system substrate-binding protein